jgi:hypothetical protein
VAFSPRSALRLCQRLVAAGPITAESLSRAIRAEYILPLAEESDRDIVWAQANSILEPELKKLGLGSLGQEAIPTPTAESIAKKYFGGRLPDLGSDFAWTEHTLNLVDEMLLDRSSQELSKRCSFPPAADPPTGENFQSPKRISVFIGGTSKAYQFDCSHFEKWLRELKAFAEEFSYELLITTSRRTEPRISELVKREFTNHPSCKLLVIANESNIENVTYGMLALSDIAIVTEDSVSMISEAVSTGIKNNFALKEVISII